MNTGIVNLNSIETYRNAGRIAARAAHRNDGALANSTHQWLRQALRREDIGYAQQAREAFNEAYRRESDETGGKTFFL